MTPILAGRARQVHTTVASAPQVRGAGRGIAAASIAAIAVATLLPEVRQPATSAFCLICGPRGGVDAILNVLLFLPLGLGLSMSGARWKRALIALCSLSALIELTQLLIITGRNATLGDFLTNSVGGAVGFAIGRYARVWARPSRRAAMTLAAGWGMCWLTQQTVVSFAFAPALPNSRYYGQIAHTFAHLATFRGEVLAASVGSDTLPNSAVLNSRALQERLRQGATVSAVVIPAGPTADIAPILRVADGERREILVLSQKGADLVFGVRIGGAVLRLRPPLFTISKAFPMTGGASEKRGTDTLLISGRYGRSAVTMRVQGKSTILERRYSLSAPLGWTLLSPFQWYVNGSERERLITLLWTATLLLPLGYWAAHIGGDRQASDNAASWKSVVIGVAALVGIGFFLIPYLFGLAAPSIVEWLAALCGLGAGRELARAFPRERTNIS